MRNKEIKNIITVSNEDKSSSLYIAERFDLRCDYQVENQVIPLHNLDAFASIVSQVVEETDFEDFISIGSVPSVDGALHVKGNSMYPLLYNGDIVLYKVTPSRRGGLYFGNIYVVAYIYEGEEHIVIKYVDESKIPGHYTLRSHNPDYPSFDIPRDSVRVLALVKTSLRHYH